MRRTYKFNEHQPVSSDDIEKSNFPDLKHGSFGDDVHIQGIIVYESSNKRYPVN